MLKRSGVRDDILRLKRHEVTRIVGTLGGTADPRMTHNSKTATNSRVRVMTLVDSLGRSGGAERLASELTQQLDPDRLERTLCVTRWDPAIADSESGAAALAGLSDSGVHFLGLERRSRLALAPWRVLRDHLRERQIDVLHTHMFGSNAWGAIVGPAAGVPVLVAHEHSWSFEGRPGRRFIDRRLIAHRADAFIAVSREDRRRMIEVEGIDTDKVRLIPNGMPPVARLGGAGDLRRELGVSDAPLIGAVGNLRPEKALDVLLEATALVAESVPSVHLAIAGEGDQAPLRAQAEELGIAGQVHLLGFRSDAGAVIDALDVAVNCSVREGSPLAVMEFMDAGVPVVATRVGGVPDLLEDGVCGLLVPAREPVALARAVTGLLTDRSRASEMGRRAQERRRSHFDLGKMAQRVEGLYMELLVGKQCVTRN